MSPQEFLMMIELCLAELKASSRSQFQGPMQLLRVEDGVNTWQQDLAPYPQSLLHLKKLRYALKAGGCGVIEDLAIERILKLELADTIGFTANVPWQYYKNHIKSPAYTANVKLLNRFIRRKKKTKEDLAKVLKKYSFRSLPDLLGTKENLVQLWEVKGPFDNHRPNLKLMTELAEFGFNVNLLLINETEIKARKRNRKLALDCSRQAFAEFRNSKLFKKINAQVSLPIQNFYSPINTDFKNASKIGVSPYYLVYILTRHVERPMGELSLSLDELLELSQVIFNSGSHYWARVSLTLMPLLNSTSIDDGAAPFLKAIYLWEKRFRTTEKPLQLNTLLQHFKSIVRNNNRVHPRLIRLDMHDLYFTRTVR